ncbi:Cytochrome P450 monooxygenase [Rhizoctonia solani]|uniref:Cytochrome P450 monooxygenase n=1 Tax=Rhizoctonia solani TaxID=456999 RepID=A0A8H7ID02_9AGAM|nr:Cytochrome P450 monooxygenase [Rhizoctonia solani]
MSVEQSHSSTPQYCITAAAVLLAYYLVPYFRDPHNYRRRFPGPLSASFSNWWMTRNALSGKYSETLHELHTRYVYGHSSGLLKSEFYDAFKTDSEGDIFNSRDKAVHTMKRKRIANIYSAQNVLAFEPRVRVTSSDSVPSWIFDANRLFKASLDLTGKSRMGALSSTAVPWTRPRLLCPCFKEKRSKLTHNTDYFSKWDIRQIYRFLFFTGSKVPAFLHETGFVCPNLFRNITKAAVDARARKVESGKVDEEGRGIDLLDKLFEVKNHDGSPLSKSEIDSEAMITIGAGSDTTSNTLAALCYYITADSNIKKRLQEELDSIRSNAGTDTNTLEKGQSGYRIFDFEQVKNLPYLNACIKETLRLYSTVGTGLPRVVPAGRTFTVAGENFSEGSVISVPSYSTNRSSVWGADPDVYRPERWLEEGSGSLNKYYVPFSTGPRACIGRNLANMNLLLVSACVLQSIRCPVTHSYHKATCTPPPPSDLAHTKYRDAPSCVVFASSTTPHGQET